MMDAWIPLLQSLVWPIFIVGILALNRNKVLAFLDAVIDRVKKGDAWRFGSVGMDQSRSQDAYSKGDKVEPIRMQETDEFDERFSWGAYPEMPADIRKARVIRLVHRIGPWGKDDDDTTRRGVEVKLITTPDELLEDIKKVTYYLPDSWPKRLRKQEKRNKADNFLLETRAYGEVTVAARVEFKDDTPSLIINRYCNFYEE